MSKVSQLLIVTIYLIADAKRDRNIHSGRYEHVDYPAYV